MKIGMLSQWFDPETGPAALPGVYAREFIRKGHEVSVLTGFPNYPEGKLYPGYRLRMRRAEQVGGVHVTRVPLFPSHSRSSLGRIANYASFSLSAAALGRPALRNADAVWVYNSPATVALPMLAHTNFGRTPIFLHIQDLWPESLTESGMFPRGLIGRIGSVVASTLAHLTERRSSFIGVISPTVREIVIERNPHLDPSRIIYAPNPTNENLFRPSEEIRREQGIVKSTDHPFVEFMYAGAIGDVQGLDTLLEAASLLRQRNDIKITLVGDGIGRSRLEEKAARANLTNVEFLGRVQQTAIPILMARSDVQIVSLSASPFLRYTTPSKISSILASGLPIVAQIEGDGAMLIKRSGAGTTVAPGRAEELAIAIEEMADMGHRERSLLGASGMRYYKAELSSTSAAQRILTAFKTTR